MYTKRLSLFEVLLFVFFALILFSSRTLAGETEPLESKAAVVNGTIITQAEVDSQMNMVIDRLHDSGRFPSVAELSQIRNQVLENLIARELLYQESQKKGIKADQEAVSTQFATLKAQFPNEAEFKNALGRMHLTEAELKFKIERDFAIRQLVDDQIAQKVTVSDTEMREYYDSHPERFQKPEQVRASHILIKVDPKADQLQKAEAREKITQIQKKLQKGEDFGSLAKEYSEGPSAAEGGDLGYFTRGQMVKPFEDAAFAMKRGDVSDMVETRFGYHLIKVTDKAPETTISYEDVKDRLGQFLKQRKIQQEIEPYVKTLEVKAKIERSMQED